MSDTNNPQPCDPPVNTGGGGTTNAEPEPESEESGEAQATDPPQTIHGSGGGGRD